MVEEQEMAPNSVGFSSRAQDLLSRLHPVAIALSRPAGDTAARKRIEVAGVLQVSAHRRSGSVVDVASTFCIVAAP